MSKPNEDTSFGLPAEVLAHYEPIKTVGKGGFASVVLAKNRKTQEQVAVKRVAHQTPKERGYAHREIDILRELEPHDGRMQLLDSIGDSILILSYAEGPTLEHLLEKGGAPCLAFGRVIAAQLIDVVAHLHSNAVLHRDIKPGNLIVTFKGIQDEIWQNEDVGPNQERNWPELVSKWKLTLVDFGFARALQPEDIQSDIGLHNAVNQNETMTAVPPQKNLDQSINRRMSTPFDLDGDTSVSKKLVRQWSALGSRNYAAPEVKNQATRRPTNGSDASNLDSSTKLARKTMCKFVANYGMVADSFSVGATIRYILTGVSPTEDIKDVIAAQSNPLLLLCSCLSKTFMGKEAAPKKCYRWASQLPKEAVRLMHGMTHYDSRQRTTCRTARRYPWIDDVLAGDPPGKGIRFLQLDSTAKEDEPLSDTTGNNGE